ncbi:carbohydrate-binding protein [Streptomyces sp. H10-C2]|uniref:carbohydrate-binding protein n=1 Tax=unclassified Streptomyces TaxID=2593676 RepID=UPI0024B878A5|nr:MULTISPECIES: carbohydrate-binding protein [unclassified Streptomyces]MDJ0343964.1 carbohydrate-binding protein [Streptomyces sp. PH10-H1]MDJ0373545.1 carbohydrate-binding protein [Streptomyces sp. H10-C2]
MTAGNNGASENDDPFAYLYRSEGGEGEVPGAAAPEGATVAQPGVPRTSYNQVQRVGERRPQQGGYGYPQQQSGYDQGQNQGQGQGYVPQQSQQPQQSQTHYGPRPPDGPGPRGGGDGPAPGPNRKGLMIGAIAVVVAVAVGIGYAMTGGSGKQDEAKNNPTPSASTSASASPSQSATAPTTFSSQVVDAASLGLSGGAVKSTEQPGAKASGGAYAGGMTTVGASVTWTFDVPKDGTYTYFVSYGNAGEDAGLTLSENGKARTNPMKMRNYGSYTDWSKAWGNTTYAWVDLKKGSNTLALTCAPGNKCGVNLDQVWLKEGQVKK